MKGRSDWRADELVPGAHVEWEQYTAEGYMGIRSGQVWDRGPDVDGCRAVAWVVPYAPQDYDPYGLVAVGISSRQQDLVPDTLEVPSGSVTRGHLFTTCRPAHPLGSLGTRAAAFARQTREGRGAR